jgi:hypothetical protein
MACEPLIGDGFVGLRATTILALDNRLDDALRFGARLVDTDHGIAKLVPHLLVIGIASDDPEALGTHRRDAYMKTALLGIDLAVTCILVRE